MLPRWESTSVSHICPLWSGFQDTEQPIQLPHHMMELGEVTASATQDAGFTTAHLLLLRAST